MKGQLSSTYIGIMTIISLALFGLILLWSVVLKEGNADLLAEQQINLLIEKVESDIYFMENLGSNVSVFEKSSEIPSRIGDNFYTISLFADGGNNSGGGYFNNSEVVVRREGRNKFNIAQTVFSKKINVGVPVVLSAVHSSSEMYVLRYNSSVGVRIDGVWS